MNNPATSQIDRVALQQVWNDHRMVDSIDWQLYKSQHLMFVFEETPLVQWTYAESGPQIQRMLKVENVGLSLRTGVQITLVDQHGSHFTVDANPRQTLPGVFLWTPAFCELRFVPRDFDIPHGPRHLGLALCAKVRSRRGQLVEGHSYIATLKEFTEDWPGIF